MAANSIKGPRKRLRIRLSARMRSYCVGQALQCQPSSGWASHSRFEHTDRVRRGLGDQSAKLTKYAACAMLAPRISMTNKFACIAERCDADINAVRRGIGADPRIGQGHLCASLGYGGSCLPKQIRAVIRTSEELGVHVEAVRATEFVNARRPILLCDRIRAYFHHDLHGRTVAICGLSCKPHNDDMREAPSRVLMERLWRAGATVRAYDPAALDFTRTLYGDRSDLVLCNSRDAALSGSDCLAVVTEWPEFLNPDLGAIGNCLSRPAIFDGRNIFDTAALRSVGFDYFPVGRATAAITAVGCHASGDRRNLAPPTTNTT